MTEKEYLDALNKALKWLPKPEKEICFNYAREMIAVSYTHLAQSLNAAIREQIEAHAIAMKQQAADEYQAFIETGGKAEEYIPARISINYQLYCNNDQTLSFAIISTYVRAQSSHCLLYTSRCV